MTGRYALISRYKVAIIRVATSRRLWHGNAGANHISFMTPVQLNRLNLRLDTDK